MASSFPSTAARSSTAARWRRLKTGSTRDELRDDYVPTGFKGYGIQARAVKGHPFGLDLSPEDRRALVAFLRTL